MLPHSHEQGSELGSATKVELSTLGGDALRNTGDERQQFGRSVSSDVHTLSI